jgi:hypothetical protein
MRTSSQILSYLCCKRFKKITALGAALGSAVMVLGSPVPTARASECVGVRMPDKIEVNGNRLVLNGMGLRRATIFSVRVYVGGLYVEKPMRSSSEVLSTAAAKRLVLRFVRDVSPSEMADAIEDGIRKNAGNRAQQARREVALFTRRLPPLRKGTDLTFTYLPDKGLEVTAGKFVLGTFKDAQIIQILYRIWFGPYPPDQALKAGMLGAKCE